MKSQGIDSRDQLSGDAAIQKLRTLLPHFSSAMMLTHADDGDLHARPLALLGDVSSFGGTLWFFTDDRSRKVQESADGSPVSIVCQSDEHSAYVHLLGTAAVVRDLAKMRELYSPLLKAWFPRGLEEPHLTLLRFDASSGSYWSNPGGTLRTALSFAKAIVTGVGSKSGESGDLRV